MAAYQYLTLDIAERVGTLTINRPPVNALSQLLLEELAALLDEVVAAQQVKALVITGAGEKVFVAGADIKMFAASNPTPEVFQAIKDYIALGQTVLTKLDTLPIPTIAAINGVCLGGGMELALACDIRYAAEQAVLGLPEVNLGLIPGWGGTQRLPQIVGQSRALEIILTGEPISTLQARQIGLLSGVLPATELLDAVTRLARTIAGRSRVATTAALRAVTGGADLSLEEGLLLEQAAFEAALLSADAREGVAAFLEKRQPLFKDQ